MNKSVGLRSLTVVDEIHESGRCADSDSSPVVLKELDLLFDFHVLGELFHVSDELYEQLEGETYQLRDRVIFALELAH